MPSWGPQDSNRCQICKFCRQLASGRCCAAIANFPDQLFAAHAGIKISRNQYSGSGCDFDCDCDSGWGFDFSIACLWISAVSVSRHLGSSGRDFRWTGVVRWTPARTTTTNCCCTTMPSMTGHRSTRTSMNDCCTRRRMKKKMISRMMMMMIRCCCRCCWKSGIVFSVFFSGTGRGISSARFSAPAGGLFPRVSDRAPLSGPLFRRPSGLFLSFPAVPGASPPEAPGRRLAPPRVSPC